MREKFANYIWLAGEKTLILSASSEHMKTDIIILHDLCIGPEWFLYSFNFNNLEMF